MTQPEKYPRMTIYFRNLKELKAARKKAEAWNAQHDEPMPQPVSAYVRWLIRERGDV